MLSRLFRIPHRGEKCWECVEKIFRTGESIPYRGEKCGKVPQIVWKNVCGNPSIYDLVDIVE
jgi:hypothetical protein